MLRHAGPDCQSGSILTVCPAPQFGLIGVLALGWTALVVLGMLGVDPDGA